MMYTLLLFPDRRKVLYCANFKVRRCAEGYNTKRRRKILRRFDKRCVYCGEPLTINTATVDHIRPKVQGGSGIQRNLTICCYACNRAKGHRTPQEWLAHLMEACKQLGCLPVECEVPA